MDMRLGEDLYESFINYQTRMLAVYDKMIEEYHFRVIDAMLPAEQVVDRIKRQILPLLPHG